MKLGIYRFKIVREEPIIDFSANFAKLNNDY